MEIDLRNCEKGDILISSHGAMLEYICPTPWKGRTYLDHVVRYMRNPDGSLYEEENYGTRTHDGFVFKNKRMPETDHDIVEVIKKDDYFAEHDDLVYRLMRTYWEGIAEDDEKLQDIKNEMMDYHKDEIINIFLAVLTKTFINPIPYVSSLPDPTEENTDNQKDTH